MKKLLLQVCCAPCSTHCINELKKEYDITMYFFNPNIHPFGEYIRRLDEAKKVSEELGIPLIEGNYEPETWLDSIAGFEDEPEGGRRCSICFDVRLLETAQYAKEKGYDIFTTTMTISPHKNSAMINKIGERLGDLHDLEWLHSDFKKKDGFRKSTEMSRQMGLYRQKYCGCFYSVH